jgi:hypothetical protein
LDATGHEAPGKHDRENDAETYPRSSQKSLPLHHDASVPCQIFGRKPSPAKPMSGRHLAPQPFIVQQILKRRFVVYSKNGLIKFFPHGYKGAVAIKRAFCFGHTGHAVGGVFISLHEAQDVADCDLIR